MLWVSSPGGQPEALFAPGNQLGQRGCCGQEFPRSCVCDPFLVLPWRLGEGFGGFDEPAFGEEVVFVGFVGAAVEGLQGGLGVPGDEGEAIGLAGGEGGGGLHLFLFEGPLDGLPVGFGIEGAGDYFFDAIEGGVEGVGVGGGVGALVVLGLKVTVSHSMLASRAAVGE